MGSLLSMGAATTGGSGVAAATQAAGAGTAGAGATGFASGLASLIKGQNVTSPALQNMDKILTSNAQQGVQSNPYMQQASASNQQMLDLLNFLSR